MVGWRRDTGSSVGTFWVFWGVFFDWLTIFGNVDLGALMLPDDVGRR